MPPNSPASQRLDIARALWAFGEDAVLAQVDSLDDGQVAAIAAICRTRLGYEPIERRTLKEVRVAMLATSAIQLIEGAPRDLARSFARNSAAMPARLRGW